MIYDFGQPAVLFIEDIRTASGVLADPATLTLTIALPDGSTVTKNIGDLTHIGTGHYAYTFTPSAAGDYAYRFVATVPTTVGEGVFSVRRSVVVNGASPASAGTCSPWAELGDVCSPCNTYEFDTTVLEQAMQAASDVLYNLTGRRWPGECQETLRPCGYGTSRSHWCGCNDSRSCGCARLSQIKLPGYPVTSVQLVKIDGTPVNSARYRLDDHRMLTYLSESDSAERRGWPCCQRLDRADSEDDTWSVTYTFGSAPPVGGVQAAATLACQLALACDPSTVNDCRLPKRVTSITRQGVTLAVLDPLTLFRDGLTGLADVDLWVQSVLRGDKTRRATVHVPGRGQTHRRVGR